MKNVFNSLLLVAVAACFSACTKSENEPEPAASAGQAVDLGLSVKWADRNIGAAKPEDYGNYYAWGETQTKSVYNGSTYKYGVAKEGYDYDCWLTKYCTDAAYGLNGFTDGKTTLEPQDDAAHVNWGGEWRMPTQAECQELVDSCTWTYNSANKTCIVIGPNGNSIILPSSSFMQGDELMKYENDCEFLAYFWSNSMFIDSTDMMYQYEGQRSGNGFYISGGPGELLGIAQQGSGFRGLGLTIRPVMP